MAVYPVVLDGVEVGTVNMEAEGLYFHFDCQCNIPGEPMVSLYAEQQHLGVLVPEKGHLCLATKVPRKRFEGKNITFHLVRKDKADDGIFIPVCEEKAFPHIEKLREARFVETKDGPAIRLPAKYFYPTEEGR